MSSSDISPQITQQLQWLHFRCADLIASRASRFALDPNNVAQILLILSTCSASKPAFVLFLVLVGCVRFKSNPGEDGGEKTMAFQR